MWPRTQRYVWEALTELSQYANGLRYDYKWHDIALSCWMPTLASDSAWTNADMLHIVCKRKHVVDVVLAQNTSCTVYAAYQLCQHLQHLQTIAMQKRANEQPPSAHGSCLAALRPSCKYWLVEQISSTDKCSCNKGICMHEHAYIAMQCILRDLNDVWL